MNMQEERTNVPKIRFKGYAEEWEERKLEDIATMNARIGWQNLRTSEFLKNGEYMLITGTDFKNGEIDYSNIHYVAKERYDQDKKIQIQNGSILITKDGTLGKVAYVQGLSAPATLNAGVFNVKVREGSKVNRKYLFHYLKAPFLLKFANEQSTGGTIKHLNQNVLVKFPIPLPNFDEQTKISDFLTTLDNTIALHQRGLDLLKQTKQSYLQKMFPKKGEDKPEIRFAGFTDTWEQRKFGDSFSFPVSTNSLSRAMLNYDAGEVKNVHYGDVLIRYPSILDIRREEIPFITNGTLEKYKANILVNGDLIFADAAEDETVGKAVEIHGIIDEYIVSGLHTIVARANQPKAEYFLGYYINSDNYHRQLLRLIQGSKVSAISKGNLQKTEVTFPTDYEEQRKIGSFFKQLDDTIALHQRELDSLKEMKKSLLQQMFV